MLLKLLLEDLLLKYRLLCHSHLQGCLSIILSLTKRLLVSRLDIGIRRSCSSNRSTLLGYLLLKQLLLNYRLLSHDHLL